MNTLYITRGYPGSGKTTIARRMVEEHNNIVRMNRDDLRFNMFGAYSGLSEMQENAITLVQVSAVTELLNDGFDVVVDDTNLNIRTFEMWRTHAQLCGVHFRVIDVTTDVDECHRRNEERHRNGERAVHKEIIEFFAHRYPMPWAEVQ